jgi:hypothetical protein
MSCGGRFVLPSRDSISLNNSIPTVIVPTNHTLPSFFLLYRQKRSSTHQLRFAPSTSSPRWPPQAEASASRNPRATPSSATHLSPARSANPSSAASLPLRLPSRARPVRPFFNDYGHRLLVSRRCISGMLWLQKEGKTRQEGKQLVLTKML